MLLVDEQLIKKYSKFAWRTIHQNRRLVYALRLEDEDVYQELMIAMIKAVRGYDPNRNCTLDDHVSVKMRFALLQLKNSHKPHGVAGAKGKQLEFKTVDTYGDNFTFDDDITPIDYDEFFSVLSNDEKDVLKLSYEGNYLRKNSQKEIMKSVQMKFMTLMGDAELCKNRCAG